MKASASLLFLFLVVAGCTERTTTPTELAPPDVVFGARAGNPPPPPADVAVAICTSGGTCAVFEGTYMSNGSVASGRMSIPIGFASFTAAAAQGDGACTFPGHASLKIDGLIDIGGFTGNSSSNAQIKCRHQVASGNGTLEVGTVVLSLDHVDLFNNQPDCSAECGTFIVRDEEGNQIAFGEVIEREFFDESCDIGEGGVFCGSD